MTNRVSPFKGRSFTDQFARWLEILRVRVDSAPDNFEGAGTPEATVYARAGSRYYNTSGGPGTYLYVKTTAASLNTGWVAYG